CCSASRLSLFPYSTLFRSRLSGLVLLPDCLGNRLELVLRVLVELVLLVHAADGQVGGNLHHVELVDVPELGRFRRRGAGHAGQLDRKSTRLNSSHVSTSYS